MLIPIITITYFAITKRSIRFLITKRFAVFLAVAFLIISPWLIYMSFYFNNDFWNSYFLYSVYIRTVSPIEGHGQSFLYYFNYLATSENLLWVLLLPIAAGLCAVKAVIIRSKADILILIWMAIVLAIFTFAQTKIYYYILPAYPAFAIAIASFIYLVSKKIKSSLHSPKL